MILPLAFMIFMQAGHGITLSWTPSVSGAVTSQIICRGTKPGTEDCAHPIATFNDNTTKTYTDNSRQSGVVYYYVVEACAGLSCSVPSNEVNTNPAAPNLTGKPQ